MKYFFIDGKDCNFNQIIKKIKKEKQKKIIYYFTFKSVLEIKNLIPLNLNELNTEIYFVQFFRDRSDNTQFILSNYLNKFISKTKRERNTYTIISKKEDYNVFVDYYKNKYNITLNICECF